MAFDEELADRLRTIFRRKQGIEEKKMFGGLCFLLHGNILLGIWKNALIARLGPEQARDALLEPHVEPMAITGKPMKGWVLVQPAGFETEENLTEWVRRSVKFVGKIPRKE